MSWTYPGDEGGNVARVTGSTPHPARTPTVSLFCNLKKFRRYKKYNSLKLSNRIILTHYKHLKVFKESNVGTLLFG